MKERERFWPSFKPPVSCTMQLLCISSSNLILSLSVAGRKRVKERKREGEKAIEKESDGERERNYVAVP